MEEITNQMVKNEIPTIKKPKKLPTLDKMVQELESSTSLEDKLKYYGWIHSYISELENELFSDST